MASRIEVVSYAPAYTLPVAQAYLEVFTPPPWNEAATLNDMLAQLESDMDRPGAGAVLLQATSIGNIVAFSWWFDMTGAELYDRWRPRFTPRENVPQPEGRGVFLMELGVVPTLRNHGLGKRLLDATLDAIEPTHDWIALSTQRFAHAGLALLKSAAFEELALTGVQVPTRICLFKRLQHA